MAYTLPMLYEKYEDQVDIVGEKALIEIKKQYKVIDAKFISKIPMLSEKKQHWERVLQRSNSAHYQYMKVVPLALLYHHLATFKMIP